MEMFMLNSLVSRITIHLLEGQQERPWEGQHWKVYSRVRWMGAWGKRYTSSHSSFQVLKDWTIWCFSYFAFHSISGAGSQSRENKNEEFNEEGKKNDTSCNKGRAPLESFSVLLPGCYDVCLNFEKRVSSLAKRRTAPAEGQIQAPDRNQHSWS